MTNQEPMTELKKLIEAANAYVDFHGGILPVIGNPYKGEKIAQTLHDAIPAAEAELAGMGEALEVGERVAVSSHKEKFDSAMQSYKDALREAKREAWEEGFQACVRSTSLKVDIYAEDNPYAPPSESEEKL